jgi:anthranilate synthase/aminodeoxychorismate synthase-like glutamine amidotransferase
VSARLLLIDNYDSFTYNLVQAFLVLGADVRVYRNDAITIEEARALQPTHLCISPGPGTPQRAGVSMAMVRAFAGQIPVFGVCLGHQSIVEVFGGKVVRAGRLMHGKTSLVDHDERGVFEDIPAGCEVGRYHSLIAEPDSMPAELEVSARTPRARSWACGTGADGRGRAVSSGERTDAGRAGDDAQLPAL